MRSPLPFYGRGDFFIQGGDMSNIRYEKYQLRVNNPDGISSNDVLDSIQSQYAASSHMLALLVSKAALADPGKDVMVYYDKIFNPRTAEGIGLDIWGRIVGANRTLEMEERRWFGFQQGHLQPFDQGVFWTGENAFYTADLSDEDYRTLIFWKAAANIASAEAPALNKLLQDLFPGHTCFVLEDGPMHIRVVTRVELSVAEEAIFRRYGLLAKGAGVGVGWLAVPLGTFGFAGTELEPFDQGVFFAGQIINYEQREGA